MKKGFTLAYALILIIVMGILLKMMNTLNITEQRFLQNFYREQQQIILKYSIEKDKIIIPENTKIQNDLGLE